MIEKTTRYLKLLRKYNTLETEHNVLLEDIKNDCFNKILEIAGQPLEIKRLKTENKRLRLKIKSMKEITKKEMEDKWNKKTKK